MSLDTKINDLLSFLDGIQGWSAALLVYVSCIVVGYMLRFIKKFPNDGIPVVVILWGALIMLFIADPRATTMSARVWTTRNICVGLTIGMAAWLSHKFALSWIEDKISSKFNLGNTAFFTKQNAGQPADPSGQSPKPPVT